MPYKWVSIIVSKQYITRVYFTLYIWMIQYAIFLWIFYIGSGESLKIGSQIKGWALGWVIPGLSSMSITGPSFPSTFHSKHWIIAARLVWTKCNARDAPGHTLRPLPNGKRWKFCPLTSNWFFKVPSSLRNLPGLNSSGSSQCFGSLPMAQRLTYSWVLTGIS